MDERERERAIMVMASKISTSEVKYDLWIVGSNEPHASKCNLVSIFTEVCIKLARNSP